MCAYGMMAKEDVLKTGFFQEPEETRFMEIPVLGHA